MTLYECLCDTNTRKKEAGPEGREGGYARPEKASARARATQKWATSTVIQTTLIDPPPVDNIGEEARMPEPPPQSGIYAGKG